MIHVEEINDIQRLADDRLLWNALLPQTPGASFFHRLDWLELYWRHFGDGSGCGPWSSAPTASRWESSPWSSATNKRGSATCGRSPIRCTTGALSMARSARIPRRPCWPASAMSPKSAATGTCSTSAGSMSTAAIAGGANGRWSKSAFVPRPSLGRRPADRDRRHVGGLLEWAGRKWRHNVERCSRRLDESGEVSLVRYRPQGRPAATAIPAGTFTTPASIWPRGVGKAAAATTPRSAARACGSSFAKSTPRPPGRETSI